jgi:hypothetical protein
MKESQNKGDNMCRKILIPYLSSDYNQFVENFQIEKIKTMEKDKLIVNLKNSESWIYDCYLREKCINLFLKTGGFFNLGLTADDLYKIGVDITINQINKQYFFDSENTCNLFILKKIKSRIVNNMRNYFSPTRRINYFQFQNSFHQIENSYENFEVDLEKIDRETLKNGLRKVWEDAIGDVDFDLSDFEVLCTKYGFRPLDLLVYNPYIIPQMSKEACNNGNCQLVLVFNDEEVA